MINLALSFVAVVKAKSFSKAAKEINISKAQLSRQVKQLETELGIQLIHRTNREIVLTESGELFFASCHGIEESYADAVCQIKENFKLTRGTLRITAPIDFGIKFLPKIMHEFGKHYPNINIVLSLSNVNEDMIENNFDIAIRIANALPDSNLRMRTLKEFQRVICASSQYFKNHDIPKKIADLNQHRCITSLNRNSNIIKPQWQFYKNGKLTNYTLNNVIEVDSLEAQIELLTLGSGIGRIPNYLIQNKLDSGKFVEVLPQIKKPKSYIYLLYPNQKVLPAKTQVFLDFLKEHPIE